MTDPFPRENLLRGLWPGVQLRCDDLEGSVERSADPFLVPDGQRGPGITGHFAVFNRWTEIDSMFEGNFMERIAPGAFKRTINANRAGMRVLFQHGRDYQIGSKPLGTIDSLAEDDIGARYDVSLLDTSYNRDLIPGLQAGLYGASFRFNVIREDLVMEPKRSRDNPKGIPERTIREARVSEFGPVTFGAYPEATAGMRSLTDDDLIERLAASDPDRLAELVERVRRREDGEHVESTTDPVITPAGEPGPEPTPPAAREAPTRAPLVVIRNPNRRRRTAA